jgi:hypothetical protein
MSQAFKERHVSYVSSAPVLGITILLRHNDLKAMHLGVQTFTQGVTIRKRPEYGALGGAKSATLCMIYCQACVTSRAKRLETTCGDAMTSPDAMFAVARNQGHGRP